MSARLNSLRAAIIPLGSCQATAGTLHPVFQLKKNTEEMGKAQQRFTKLIRGLMNMMYKKKMSKKCDLLSLEEGELSRDLVTVFQ